MALITRITTPSTSSGKSFLDQADELLANFPGVDQSKLLRSVIGLYLMDFKYGNKREERAACDFLNLVQAEAVRQLGGKIK